MKKILLTIILFTISINAFAVTVYRHQVALTTPYFKSYSAVCDYILPRVLNGAGNSNKQIANTSPTNCQITYDFTSGSSVFHNTANYALVNSSVCPTAPNTFWNETTQACNAVVTCTGTDTYDANTNTCIPAVNPCATTQNQIISQTMGYDSASSVCISGCSYTDESSVGVCSGTTCTGSKFKGTGNQCTASNGASSLTEEQKCLSSGMSFGEVTNGTTTKTICVPKTTQGAAPTVTNANGTKTSVNNGVTTVTNTTTNTNTSNNTVVKTTVTTNPDGSTSTKVDTQDLPSFCEENPNSTVCNPEKVEGAEKGNPNGYTAQNGGFYEPKYPNGITGIWDNAKSSINASGAHNAINALSPNFPDSGSAPSWTFNFNMGQGMNFGTQELATNDAIWAVIRLIFLITTLFTARSIIFGG